MSEYIDRQAAIEVCDWYEHEFVECEYAVRLVADDLKKLPSADVEPVVRCKDCKHYQFADHRAFGFPVKRCDVTGFEDVEDNDFCSRGARMDGEQDG